MSAEDPRRRCAEERGLSALTPTAAGVLHAAASLYWAVGGRWLLATVGQWAVELSAQAPVVAGIALGLVALVKLLAATVPIGVAYGKVRWAGFWRAVSWVGGLLLVVYGVINIGVSAAVLGGLIHPEGGYDPDAMRGHAYLWDPLFFVWGSVLVLSLWFSRRVEAAGPTAREGMTTA
jgi:hypothetical protein